MEQLTRETAVPNMIDPTGKKWVIKGERGTALVHARPDPDRADAQIPKSFRGKWTSPTVLREKIQVWLNFQWSEVEAKEKQKEGKQRAALQREEEAKAPQKTVEESLAELPEEIRETLGDIIATEENDGEDTEKDTQGESREAGSEGPANEAEESESSEALSNSEAVAEEKEEAVAFKDMEYHELLKLAKENGIEAKKKVEIIAELEAL